MDVDDLVDLSDSIPKDVHANAPTLQMQVPAKTKGKKKNQRQKAVPGSRVSEVNIAPANNPLDSRLSVVG